MLTCLLCRQVHHLPVISTCLLCQQPPHLPVMPTCLLWQQRLQIRGIKACEIKEKTLCTAPLFEVLLDADQLVDRSLRQACNRSAYKQIKYSQIVRLLPKKTQLFPCTSHGTVAVRRFAPIIYYILYIIYYILYTIYYILDVICYMLYII